MKIGSEPAKIGGRGPRYTKIKYDFSGLCLVQIPRILNVTLGNRVQYGETTEFKVKNAMTRQTDIRYYYINGTILHVQCALFFWDP